MTQRQMEMMSTNKNQFLILDKGFSRKAHIWTGSDTLCRIPWRIPASYTCHATMDGREICRSCWRELSIEGQIDLVDKLSWQLYQSDTTIEEITGGVPYSNTWRKDKADAASQHQD